jgi:hypothetical protein
MNEVVYTDDRFRRRGWRQLGIGRRSSQVRLRDKVEIVHP